MDGCTTQFLASTGIAALTWGCAEGAVCSSIEPVFPAGADVIVALGGGITGDGEPLPATAARARRAAALYHAGRAPRIVMSGAHGMFDPRPPRAEATAMAQIAVAVGVPEEDLAVETRSRDTIGNIWFTKELLAQRGGRRVIVVTCGWHAPRVRYLARTIWGPAYAVAVEPVAVCLRRRDAQHLIGPTRDGCIRRSGWPPAAC